MYWFTALMFYLYLQAVKGGHSKLVYCIIFYHYLPAVKEGHSILVHCLIFPLVTYRLLREEAVYWFTS